MFITYLIMLLLDNCCAHSLQCLVLTQSGLAVLFTYKQQGQAKVEFYHHLNQHGLEELLLDFFTLFNVQNFCLHLLGTFFDLSKAFKKFVSGFQKTVYHNFKFNKKT